MEGSDVFMSAFSNLKQFGFFQEVTNWFLPFYRDNEYVTDALHAENEQINTDSFLQALEQSNFICNSDKYSFCLNIKHIPQQQKSQMMQMLNSELEGMKDISNEEEKSDPFSKSKTVYTQYVQDLYRFFKLSPLKYEFEDIFETKLDIHNTELFRSIVNDNSVLRNIAEFYFSKNYFDEALEVYLDLAHSNKNDYELYEKIAYCYQMQKDYQNALDYYLKAELFDENKEWVLKKIALCYRYLNNHEQALRYYQEAEKLQPDNLYVQAYIGHTLLELDRYQEALQYYFKVEYLAPENEKIRRPIAWCSFVLGKFESSERYYKKLLEKAKNPDDLVGLGHVYMCEGHTESAIEQYKEAYRNLEYNYRNFREAFLDDIDSMEEHGINRFDAYLMMEYVKYFS